MFVIYNFKEINRNVRKNEIFNKKNSLRINHKKLKIKKINNIIVIKILVIWTVEIF